MGSSLIFGSNLPKYTARQQEFDRDKDARKADLALRNALQEQQMKEEGATSRQKYAVDAGLEQEKMQQAGATLRATPTMEGQNIKNDIERAYGMRDAEAGVSKIELGNDKASMENALQYDTFESTRDAANAGNLALKSGAEYNTVKNVASLGNLKPPRSTNLYDNQLLLDDFAQGKRRRLLPKPVV